MWEELGAALAPTHHVFAPDLPGHGDTDPVEEMDRRSLAATIPPLLDEFGIERAAFVGASLGGIVSLTLAADQPGRVAAIALIDIGHRLEDEGVNRIIDFMTRHESFASPEEAAIEVAEYLPHRRQVNADNLRRNLRELPDGRWVCFNAVTQPGISTVYVVPTDGGEWTAITDGRFWVGVGVGVVGVWAWHKYRPAPAQ